MIFELENSSHRFNFEFTNTADGIFLYAISAPKEYRSRTHVAFPVENNQIIWNEYQTELLGLDAKMMNHMERLWRLRAFW